MIAWACRCKGEGRKTYSLSRNSWYSSSPALTGEPPNCKPGVSRGPQTLNPAPLSHQPPTTNHHIERDGLPYLGDQDAVALLDAHGQAVALLVKGAGADGKDLGLVELLDAGLGQEDAAGSPGLSLDALDQDAVEERGEGADGADRGSLLRGRRG